MRLHEEGVSVRQIAQRMGMGRQTVRRYLNHGAFPEIITPQNAQHPRSLGAVPA